MKLEAGRAYRCMVGVHTDVVMGKAWEAVNSLHSSLLLNIAEIYNTIYGRKRSGKCSEPYK